jgi:hypothetical protein
MPSANGDFKPTARTVGEVRGREVDYDLVHDYEQPWYYFGPLSDDRSARPVIRTQFSVDGRSFESRYVDLQGRSRDEAETRQLFYRYPVGTKVAVYYNLNDPSEACLDPTSSLHILRRPIIRTVLVGVCRAFRVDLSTNAARLPRRGSRIGGGHDVRRRSLPEHTVLDSLIRRLGDSRRARGNGHRICLRSTNSPCLRTPSRREIHTAQTVF